jgi:hypothetical protein
MHLLPVPCATAVAQAQHVKKGLEKSHEPVRVCQERIVTGRPKPQQCNADAQP